ncbi:MAG: hypothetical protein V3W18_05535 [candidate division Zixibacteria bacterium]
MTEEKKKCFIIMPITTPEHFLDKYRDSPHHFSHVLDYLFIPAIESSGYDPVPPKFKGSDVIQGEIIKNLEEADLVLCDMSCLNPNVFFEFGIRTALNHPVCITKDELIKKVPFDPSIQNYHEYKSTLESWELDDEIKKLTDHIKESATRSKGENSLWKYFGLSSEARPHEGATGVDAKLDYLTLQFDSLRQQISTITKDSDLDLSDQDPSKTVSSLLTIIRPLIEPEAELISFGHSPHTGYNVQYTGTIPEQIKKNLIMFIELVYDGKLNFEKLSEKPY